MWEKVKGPSMLGASGSFSRIVAAAFYMFPIFGGSSGYKTRRQWHSLWEIPIQKFFIVNSFFFFFLMWLGKLSCLRNISGWIFWNWHSLLAYCGWLGAYIIKYCAFGLQTSCLGQLFFLVMNLYVLPCAFAFPHTTMLFKHLLLNCSYG